MAIQLWEQLYLLPYILNLILQPRIKRNIFTCVLRQLFDVIIVDDHSNDKTLEILNQQSKALLSVWAIIPMAIEFVARVDKGNII